MNFINTSITGTLNISISLSKLQIHNSDFEDIVVANNATITSVNIFGTDIKKLEMGHLTYHGKTKSEPENKLSPSQLNCKQESHSKLFDFVETTGEVKIHYGLLAAIILGSVIAFVIFHVSYRRYKYQAYLATESSIEDMNQRQNQQEMEGPDYYESVDLFRNYHVDAIRTTDASQIRDSTYAVPEYSAI